MRLWSEIRKHDSTPKRNAETWFNSEAKCENMIQCRGQMRNQGNTNALFSTLLGYLIALSASEYENMIRFWSNIENMIRFWSKMRKHESILKQNAKNMIRCRRAMRTELDVGAHHKSRTTCGVSSRDLLLCQSQTLNPDATLEQLAAVDPILIL